MSPAAGQHFALFACGVLTQCLPDAVGARIRVRGKLVTHRSSSRSWWRRAESNCRQADFQKTPTLRNDAYLRLRLCESLQWAAQSGTGVGTTALYGTSLGATRGARAPEDGRPRGHLYHAPECACTRAHARSNREQARGLTRVGDTVRLRRVAYGTTGLSALAWPRILPLLRRRPHGRHRSPPRRSRPARGPRPPLGALVCLPKRAGLEPARREHQPFDSRYLR